MVGLTKMSARSALPAALMTLGLALHAGPAVPQEDSGDQALPRILQIQPQPPDDPAEFGDYIKVQLEDLSELNKNGRFDSADLVLHLNHQPMPHLFAQSDDSGDRAVLFKLKPDDGTLTEPEREALRQAWRDLLGSPDPVVPLTVGLSYSGNALSYIDSDTGKRQIRFEVYNRWVFGLGMILLALLAATFVYLARKSDIIRDSGPPKPPPGMRRPYSLARTQMAFWTLLVLGAFGFIYLVTDYHQTITEQVLVLLGIAAATALGSVAINSRKSSTVDAELDRLAPERARVQAELHQIRERIPDLDANIGELLKQHTALNRALTPAEQEALDRQKELLRQEKVAEAGKGAELKRIDDQIALNESQLIKPVSEGFWRDLITDKGGSHTPSVADPGLDDRTGSDLHLGSLGTPHNARL